MAHYTPIPEAAPRGPIDYRADLAALRVIWLDLRRPAHVRRAALDAANAIVQEMK